MLPYHRFLSSILLILIALTVLSVMALAGLRYTWQAAGAQNDQRLIAALETATALESQLLPTLTLTAYPMHTLPPAWTATETGTPTLTFTPLPTDTATYTPSQTATRTFTATPTPTITPTFTATRVISPTPTLAPIPGAPAPVQAISPGSYDIFNILLIGSDQRPTDGTYRTDTLIVVSVNRTTRTIALLSIPRDLYVYIPRYGLDRINTAAEHGDWMRWPGKGINLLIATIGYDLGIPIHRYARIDFNGFKKIVNTVGGVDVAVECPLSDYRLASPLLREGVESNYAWYTLPVGMHHMDGAQALWYARSRETTSDFDRSRRQQIVLRAIWHQVNARNMIVQLPDLWRQITDVVDTNLNLADVLSLLPLTADLDASRLRSYFLGPAQVTNWTTSEGAEVLLPRPAPIRDLLTRFYSPPTENRLYAEQPLVEVFNSAPHTDWDQVASARLAWEGFLPIDQGVMDERDHRHTLIYDYTGKAKPQSLAVLTRILNIKRSEVISAPDPNRTADFRVVLGDDYNACTY